MCSLTPQSHKYREENSGRVVEQVTSPGCSTGSAELPVAADSITQRTHGDVVLWMADLHAGENTRHTQLMLNILYIVQSLSTTVTGTSMNKYPQYLARCMP